MRTIRSLLAALTALLRLAGCRRFGVPRRLSVRLHRAERPDLLERGVAQEPRRDAGLHGQTSTVRSTTCRARRLALFMNRLAIALVPSTNVTANSSSVNIDLDIESFHCVTPTYSITDFARTILLHAQLFGVDHGSGGLHQHHLLQQHRQQHGVHAGDERHFRSRGLDGSSLDERRIATWRPSTSMSEPRIASRSALRERAASRPHRMRCTLIARRSAARTELDLCRRIG